MRLFKGIFSKVDQLLTGRRPVDDELFDELEELLIQADLSIHTTTKLVDALREATRKERISESEDIKVRLKGLLVDILSNGDGTKLKQPQERPAVYMFVGVNGVGKTTTIGKLAYDYKSKGKKVILGAADTFRAAAIDQLEVWADRVGVDLIKHREGSDPAAVAFDSLQAAKARQADLLIIDTAGRLHTKTNLMEELKKIERVLSRELYEAPNEVLLVLDATNGQNAVNQAKLFSKAVGVTGIALTKLDGSSKGGVVIAIKQALEIPVKLIGIGEGIDDLRPFSPEEFVDALFE